MTTRSPISPQELFQKPALLAVSRGAASVILEAQIFAYSPFFQQRRIMIGVIQTPGPGFFPFCHRKFFLSLFLFLIFLQYTLKNT